MKYELVNFCELDKYAIKSYCVIHNVDESKNLGDITKINEKELTDFNFMCGGSPCQDFSVAGKQEGAKWTCKECGYEYNPLEAEDGKEYNCPKCNSTNIEKTHSSLIVEWLRILKEKRPNFAMYENVKNIVGKQFKPTFDLFIKRLHSYGYNTYYQVLNAKDYGIPQNRERVYLIIIKKELDNGKFKFPKAFDNGIRLKDILDEEVDEKYYLSNKQIEKIQLSNFTQEKRRIQNSDICECLLARDYKDPKCVQIADLNYYNFDSMNRVYSLNGCRPTIQTLQGGGKQPKILQTVCEQRSDEGLRFFKNDICRTLRTIDSCGDKRVLEKQDNNYFIRKITPKECWRLMGFTDKDFNNAFESNVSNSQLYKQAGNSIVVDVLYEIYKELYKAMPYLFKNLKVSSYFSGIGAFEKALDMLNVEEGNNMLNIIKQ